MGQSEWKSTYNDDGDRFAGIKRVLARIFGDGENPLAWGFPIGRIAGIGFKIHLLMVVYLLVELIFTLPGHKAGAKFVLPMLFALVVLVVLHEIAHTFVARKNGGEVDQRMLWPLGGLEPARFEDEDAKAELRTAFAGIALHAAFLPVFVIPIVLLTRSWDSVLFNPFDPSASIYTLEHASTQTIHWWLVVVWSFHVVNLILLVANLIPMLPLDGGAILRVLLTPKLGSLGARHRVAIVGLVLSTILGLIGLIFADAKMLFAIAIVGGIVCTMERRRLQFLSYAEMIPGATDYQSSYKSEFEAENEQPDQSDLDQVLAKISTSGIESLSRKERRMLKKATEMSRKTEGDG